MIKVGDRTIPNNISLLIRFAQREKNPLADASTTKLAQQNKRHSPFVMNLYQNKETSFESEFQHYNNKR